MPDEEEALAGAPGPGIEARLRAARVLAVQRVLARTNWQKIADGRTARDVHPETVAAPARHSLNCGLQTMAPLMVHGLALQPPHHARGAPAHKHAKPIADHAPGGLERQASRGPPGAWPASCA